MFNSAAENFWSVKPLDPPTAEQVQAMIERLYYDQPEPHVRTEYELISFKEYQRRVSQLTHSKAPRPDSCRRPAERPGPPRPR
jgi:hypothetical protein